MSWERAKVSLVILLVISPITVMLVTVKLVCCDKNETGISLVVLNFRNYGWLSLEAEGRDNGIGHALFYCSFSYFRYISEKESY